jgi:hypothetical protein
VVAGGSFNVAGGHAANYFTLWHGGVPLVPRLAPPRLETVDCFVDFTTVPGQSYSLEYRESLSSGAWTSVTGECFGDGSVRVLRHAGGGAAPASFYRVRSAVLPVPSP